MSMKKTVIWLMIITVVSKVIGFSRDLVLAYFYGTSNISDAYLISLTIPIVLFSFIGAGIVAAYIPIYSSLEKEEGEKSAFLYTSNLISIALALCLVLFGLSFFFTEQLVGLFASGFSADTMEIAVSFTRISMISVFFSGMVYIFQSLLQVRNKFYIPALVGLPLNAVFLFSIIYSKYSNIYVLAIGSVVATIAQFLFLYPFVRKIGYKYQPIFNILDKNIKEMGRIALPVIIGVSVNEINVLVDRTLASRIVVGGISSLTYANRLNGFIVNIFVITIATVLFPVISRMAAESNMGGLKNAVSKSINAVSLILVPATIGFMIFSRQIIQLLYGRGEFSELAVMMTSGALFYYSLGMIGYSYREIIAKAFYSLKDTSTPMKNATFGVIVNIILNIILSRFLGINGLALATSISSTLTCILLFISLRKKIGSFGIKKISSSFIKVLLASMIMAVFSYISFLAMNTYVSETIALLIAIAIGSIIYFLVISLMKIEEVDEIIKQLKTKLLKTS
jgi:putative peptidoglycan lipid II flippase